MPWEGRTKSSLKSANPANSCLSFCRSALTWIWFFWARYRTAWMGSFRSSNGVWRRKKPFGLFRGFFSSWKWWDEILRLLGMDFDFSGKGFFLFFLGSELNWIWFLFFVLLFFVLFLTTDYYFNHLLFSQVSNPPFGESLLDCSLKGLEDHRQIGRRNVCQLFSGWYFCHNNT